MQVTYSSVFVESCGAHTLLGTVIRLFIPACVRLYRDKTAENTLILTIESLSKITRLIRVNQSQASKLVTDGGRTEKVTYRALGSRRSQKVLFIKQTFHLSPKYFVVPGEYPCP